MTAIALAPKQREAGTVLRWPRATVAQKLSEYQQSAASVVSQRHQAEELAVPRSTLQYWLKRQASVGSCATVVTFFESPEGLAFLHQLVVATHFVFNQVGSGSARLVSLFLELSELDRFVAASYGSQHKVGVQMEQEIVTLGQQERARLAQGMSPKKITLCQDETFHPQICLVAIAAVSNFILLEKYVQQRDAETWNKAVEEALAGLSVEVVQSTSDEGSGLCAHVKHGLGVPHSPDLFHMQQELSHATGASLSAKERHAQQEVEQAQQRLDRLSLEKTQALEKRGTLTAGMNTLFDKRQDTVQRLQQQADEHLRQAQSCRQRAQTAIEGISAAYHPYDLSTATPRSAQEVETTLAAHLKEITEVAKAATLSERCLKKIQKAGRVAVQMVTTVAFFFQMVRGIVEELDLPPELEQLLYEQYIPAFYLKQVAAKSQSAAQRKTLQATADKMLDALQQRDGPLAQLGEEQRHQLQAVALECAQLFQRSSSCVEGRNGQLALRHHSLHRLSTRKLQALTTVHNYFIQRPDGSTAAERFFGAKPRDLFEYLLQRLDVPARPAQKRSMRQRESLADAA